MKNRDLMVIHSRLDHLISIMEEVKEKRDQFYMGEWYSDKDMVAIYKEQGILYDDDAIYSSDEVGLEIDCGTAACFAGWCAIDKIVNNNSLLVYVPIYVVIEFVRGEVFDTSLYNIISIELGKISLYWKGLEHNFLQMMKQPKKFMVKSCLISRQKM